MLEKWDFSCRLIQYVLLYEKVYLLLFTYNHFNSDVG